jgi:hypothetical protein
MNNVKVFASAGLMAIVIAHALIVGVVMQAQSKPCPCPSPIATDVDPQSVSQMPDYPQISGPRINSAALHENKQGLGDRLIYNPNTGEHTRITQPTQSILENKTQGVRSQAGPCFPCSPSSVQYPSLTPSYTYPSSQQPYYYPQPTPAPSYQVPYQAQRPAAKPLKLALFVNGSQKSNAVLQWFTQNPELAALKRNCEWQVYSPTDTLYRQRYASIVPVAAMPAVLWSYQPAGDINQKAAAQIFASGGDLISSDAQLVSDMREAYGHFLHVKQAPAAQSIDANTYYRPTQSIDWNQFAAPTLLLRQASQYSEDCPGGECPDEQPNFTPEQDDRWRPFANRRPEAQGPFANLAGASLESMIALAIVLVAAVIGFAIINKKR